MWGNSPQCYGNEAPTRRSVLCSFYRLDKLSTNESSMQPEETGRRETGSHRTECGAAGLQILPLRLSASISHLEAGCLRRFKITSPDVSSRPDRTDSPMASVGSVSILFRQIVRGLSSTQSLLSPQVSRWGRVGSQRSPATPLRPRYRQRVPCNKS